MSRPSLLEVREITVIYPNGLRANDRISLRVGEGEILALLGENGAGKTTLAKVITGALQPTSGSILYKGEELRSLTKLEALRRGIYYVAQDPQLIEGLTVLEDVGLTLRLAGASFSRAELRERVLQLSKRLGLEIDPGEACERLSAGERQRVEIMKPLLLRSSLVVFDEVTTHMSPMEAESFVGIMKGMAEEGRGVIFITHKIREALSAANRVAVLRRGALVGELYASQATQERLLELMFGNGRIESATELPAPLGAPILEAASLSAGEKVRGVSFVVRAGEIVGIAGVAGNGQRELFEAVAGIRKIEEGKLLLAGRDVTRAPPKERIELGLALIPEDRLGWGLVPGLDVAMNIYFAKPRGLVLRREEALAIAAEALSEIGLVGGGPESSVDSLSGGNMQRVILARELYRKPKVVMAMNPTAGLDFSTAIATRSMLLSRAREGAGVLIISEDLDELLEISHRILVMSRGRIVGEHRRPFNINSIAKDMAS